MKVIFQNRWDSAKFGMPCTDFLGFDLVTIRFDPFLPLALLSFIIVFHGNRVYLASQIWPKFAKFAEICTRENLYA